MTIDEQSMRRIVRASMIETLANLELDKKDNPRRTVLERFSLSSAKLETDPKIIRFQFKQAIIVDASDASVEVSFKTGKGETNDAFKMKLNSNFKSDKFINDGTFFWDAQGSGWVDVLFVVDGEFDSGRNLSVNGGGVSLNDGSTIENQTLVTLAAATPTVIAAGNLNRKVSYITNHTGADLWIGDEDVTNTNKYRKLAAGGEVEYRNTAALYGYSVSGGDTSEELNT